MLSHIVATTRYADDTSRWAAVKAKDSSADKSFVYCVKTTKIYCRPTCQARLARCANVVFFDRPDQAETAGFRACKRCQPQVEDFVPEADLKIAKICVVLDDLPANAPLPRLQDLAAQAGLTKFHFHRSFKKATGFTPKEYVLANRQAPFDMATKTQTNLLMSPMSVSSGVASGHDTPALTNDSTCYSDAMGPDVDSPPNPMSCSEWDTDFWQHIVADKMAVEIPAGSQKSDALFGLTPSLLPHETAVSPSLSATIFYDTIETSHGNLLIAFLEGKVVKLDLATSDSAHLSLLHSIYPSPYYMHAPLSHMEESACKAVQQQVDAIVEALERPSGKTLDLQLSTLLQEDLGT